MVRDKPWILTMFDSEKPGKSVDIRGGYRKKNRQYEKSTENDTKIQRKREMIDMRD